MPKRTQGQPTRFVDRYRARLTEEMENQGETDRSLAEKLTGIGYPISHTAIYKTRTGTRQPAMDECMTIADLLGYDSLDEFIKGPAEVRIYRSASAMPPILLGGTMTLRETVQNALWQLWVSVREPGLAEAADRANPNWRADIRQGIQQDLHWAKADVDALWSETVRRVDEIFAEEASDAQA